MNWFGLSLASPLLNAVANHLDKYIIDKKLKGAEVGALVIFSALFNILPVGLIMLFNPSVLQVNILTALFIMINDALIVGAVLLYFYALAEDETSIIVPFYQTIPIFAFGVSYVLLGETITLTQSIGSLFLIVGALIMSLKIGEVITFRRKVAIFMLSASFLYALNSVFFKFFALDVGFWEVTFWGFVGKIVVGGLLYGCVTSYRHQFKNLFKKNGKAILGLTALSETLFMTAETVSSFAFMYASVGLVLVVGSLQPLFVFLLGIIITLFFPKIGFESFKRNDILQKVVGIIILMIGTYLVGML